MTATTDVKRPLLFLDCDGVVNSHAMVVQRRAWSHDAKAGWLRFVDPWAVAVLGEVLTVSGANVIITSTWRHTKPPDVIAGLFVVKGMREALVPRFIGATDTTGDPRGVQIGRWLVRHAEVTPAFAILDDEPIDGYLRPRLVATDPATGLLPEHVPAILARLATPWTCRERDNQHFRPVMAPHFPPYTHVRRGSAS